MWFKYSENYLVHKRVLRGFYFFWDTLYVFITKKNVHISACNGSQIHECEFEGTRYREGEIFIPSNSCSKCVCRKGFRGVLEEPFCKRTLCATQIVNYEELENYCAPLYVPLPGEKALCCPNDWVCRKCFAFLYLA